MGATGKGSKIKITIDVNENSLGNMTLADVDNYRVDFYAQLKKDTPVTGFDTHQKGDATGIAIEGNQIIAVCDTTDLDLGQLYATLTIEYTDTQLGGLKDVQTLVCEGTKVVEAPIKPAEVVEDPQDEEQQGE